MYPLLFTDNDKDISVYSITQKFLTGEQTDVHIMPLDSESVTNNMRALLMSRSVMAHT